MSVDAVSVDSMIVEALRESTGLVRRADLPDDPAAIVNEIRALEELTCSARARQARLSATLDKIRRAEEAAAGIPADQRGRAVAHEVALARRESPHRGRRHMSLARILDEELPHTRAAFDAGRISEWKATLMARETACLERAQRQQVDEEVAGDPFAMEAMGDRELVGSVRRLAATLDPAALVARRRQAESERRVTIRPAPDEMCFVTALLPVAQGVAVYAALTREAARGRRAEDPRGKGQLMADALVTRVLAPGSSGSEVPPIPVTLGLVMTDRSLLVGADDATYLEGAGEISAELGRELVAAALKGRHATWLRRLFADPQSGQLIAADSRQRKFPRGLAHLIRLRDRSCRTPWCDAPVRHTDHVVAAAAGGPTTLANGQGLCEACNYAKQARGWRALPRPGPGHIVETVTPSGHRYCSQPPVVPGLENTPMRPSRAEIWFREISLALAS